MRKRYTKNIVLFTLIVVLSFTASPVCYAYRPPLITDIAALDQLVQWYNLPEAGLAMLTNDIEITQSLMLGQTTQTKGVQAYNWGTNSGYTLRVMQGTTLVVDNPKMELGGEKEVITVESGGTLLLKRGRLDAGTNNATVAIVVKKGGNVMVESGFTLNGVIKNESPVTPNPPETPDPPEKPNPPPTEPEEKPDPPAPLLPAISNTMGFDYSLSCLQGEPPASSDYPSTEWVTYTADNVPMQKELPVRWELDAVDFGVAGAYAVKGIFSAEVLAANGLSNPNNICSTLQLTILKPGTLDTVTANVLSVGSAGNCHIRLALPPLPEGATALYIHRSTDGQNWRKAVQETYTNGHIPSFYDNFLPHAMITPTKLYVQYRYQTDYRPIWLRVEVVGSAVSGISNEIKLEMPLSAKPGDSTNTGETGDDDSSGGNRGGGGQSEGDRDLPNVPEKPSEDKTLPTDKTPPADDKLPSVPTPEQTQSGTPPPTIATELTIPTAGGTEEPSGGTSKWREPSGGTAAQGGISGNKPTESKPSDLGQEETPAPPLSLPPVVEIDSDGVTDVKALSGEVPGSPKPQKSRGVLLTAGATAFAAGALLPLRKLYIIRKRKP